MRGRPRIIDAHTDLPTGNARFRARRIASGDCRAGYAGCMGKPEEGKTSCSACAERQRSYYQQKKLKREAI